MNRHTSGIRETDPSQKNSTARATSDKAVAMEHVSRRILSIGKVEAARDPKLYQTQNMSQSNESTLNTVSARQSCSLPQSPFDAQELTILNTEAFKPPFRDPSQPHDFVHQIINTSQPVLEPTQVSTQGPPAAQSGPRPQATFPAGSGAPSEVPSVDTQGAQSRPTHGSQDQGESQGGTLPARDISEEDAKENIMTVKAGNRSADISRMSSPVANATALLQPGL
ncbi:hypothetical protein IAU60_002804 [Kwoniella sp. DSM 27419]